MSHRHFDLKSHLRKRMEELGLNGAQLARKSGVPKQSLSDWLQGVSPRNLVHLAAVSQALGVSIEALCFGPSYAKSAAPQHVDAASQHSGNPHDSVVPIDSSLTGDEWVTGVFEVKFRRVNLPGAK